jgi:uncharacterized membrane protein YgcG
MRERITGYAEDVNSLTRQYNDAIVALEDSYRMEKSMAWTGSTSHLKQQYSQRYDRLAADYQAKRRLMLEEFKQQHPQWARQRKRWEWIFLAGLLVLIVGCTGALASIGEEASQPSAASAMDNQQSVYWSADNIDIPYLRDSTQYVSNPDHVLSQQSVDRMNVTLHGIERDFGIQTIVIVVNHILNDDPFRFAQDVGNRYGVGYHDRGLMVVVGYEDHSINISPGRALEADLTDAECHRLEQRYVVPAMRAELPDSGMIYLTEAIYSTLQKKQLPVMAPLSSQDDELDDTVATIMGIALLIFVAGGAWFLKLNGKYFWLAQVGTATLMGNPFYESRRSGIYIGGGGGSFGGGGGGGFGGGSFGGGSFGGGGATSRW